jgi:Protein of unknown function (DUF2442)
MNPPEHADESSHGGVATLISTEPRCASVDFSATAIVLQLEDGRGISLPLDWLPRIKNASDADRRNYQLVDGGEEIHWPALDEDLSVPALLGLPD